MHERPAHHVTWDGRIKPMPGTRSAAAVLLGFAPGELRRRLPKMEDLVAPPDTVWLVAQDNAGVKRGTEVTLAIGDKVLKGFALKSKGNSVLVCELVKTAEVAEYVKPEGPVITPRADADADAAKALKRRLGLDEPERSGSSDDVRTLWVDFDRHGQRYKSFGTLCRRLPLRLSTGLDWRGHLRCWMSAGIFRGSW